MNIQVKSNSGKKRRIHVLKVKKKLRQKKRQMRKREKEHDMKSSDSEAKYMKTRHRKYYFFSHVSAACEMEMDNFEN